MSALVVPSLAFFHKCLSIIEKFSDQLILDIANILQNSFTEGAPMFNSFIEGIKAISWAVFMHLLAMLAFMLITTHSIKLAVLIRAESHNLVV